MLTNKQASDLLRFIAVRCVQIAKSGHPGAPLGCADIMTILWREWLKVDINNPDAANRDRFILSNGHASAMLYSLLYLRGFPITWKDLSSFRSLHSITAGHPEINQKYGIEATTGPLGQGLGMAVGIAKAAQLSKSTYHTYVLVGDGCIMEGISHEVSNLASLWELDNLIVMWDNNQITIDGAVSLVSKENTQERFKSYGWDIISADGHDYASITAAFKKAHVKNKKPKFIDFKTIIGKGVHDAEGKSSLHGSPLTEEQFLKLCQSLNVNEIMAQDIDVLKAWRACCPILKSLPSITKPLNIPKMSDNRDSKSTRQASQDWINKACAINPELIGGSADLDASVLTKPNQDSCAAYLQYGVREFGMCAIANGLAASGYRPFVGTFLVFSDYAKNAIRMSAMMHLPIIYIFSHDSIALGEDGPTHQPVEQLLTLRAIPNLETYRPADSYETELSWIEAMKRTDGPTAIILSRQTLVHVSNKNARLEDGAQIIIDCKNPILILLATGSEVSLAIEAQQALAHLEIMVVSCPNLNKFRHSSLHKKLASLCAIFVIEAASSWSWGDIQPDPRYRITLDEFGLSAPCKIVQQAFGFSKENILNKLKTLGFY